MDKARILTVNLKKAINETKNWREFYKKNIAKEKARDNNIFRGFRIPLDDIKDVLERIDSYNEKLSKKDTANIHSLRVYLAKSNANSHDASDIHVYLVPIAGGEEMEGEINTNTPLPQYGKDILKLGDEAELNLASAIYNFSTPCPQQCDEGSELYSENNID